jgi:uncharacterized protein YbaR (Trm112 family)
MIDKELLEIVRCPETKQKLTPADDKQITDLNARIEKGEIKDRGGEAVKDKIDGGLVREDGQFLYLIRNNVPVLLIDEAIPLAENFKEFQSGP